jgi:hypothetical protein
MPVSATNYFSFGFVVIVYIYIYIYIYRKGTHSPPPQPWHLCDEHVQILQISRVYTERSWVFDGCRHHRRHLKIKYGTVIERYNNNNNNNNNYGMFVPRAILFESTFPYLSHAGSGTSWKHDPCDGRVEKYTHAPTHPHIYIYICNTLPDWSQHLLLNGHLLHQYLPRVRCRLNQWD